MKVKQLPEDFIVEEVTDVVPSAGRFAFYRLDKTGWTTPDALAVIRRLWQVPAQALSYGGLKDRHARTTQYFSIYQGPQRDLQHERIHLNYLGQIPRAYQSQDIAANRFTLTLRSLSHADCERIDANGREIGLAGVPNYFDDQRFGSVNASGQFIALEMIHERFEDALKLALAGEYEHDRATDKAEKATLRKYWGDWPQCKAKLPRSHARSLVDFLIQRPGDFKGAVARLRPELSGMYLSAYQSHVWNRMLAAWIQARSSSTVDLALKLGPHPAPRFAIEHATDATLPLPSARMKNDASPEARALIDAALSADGIKLETMRVPGMQKPYFSKGDRSCLLMPSAMRSQVCNDELNRGRQAIRLTFELPRGAYATMVIKRLMANST